MFAILLFLFPNVRFFNHLFLFTLRQLFCILNSQSFHYVCARIWHIKHCPCRVYFIYFYIKFLTFFCCSSNGTINYGITSIVSADPNCFILSITIFRCTWRQELLQAREKHKEEQVIALKRSMESGMVSFYWIALMAIWLLIILLMARFFFHIFVQWFSGTGNERASSTQGGDGLPVQAWKLWGENYKLNSFWSVGFSLSLILICCNLSL